VTVVLEGAIQANVLTFMIASLLGVGLAVAPGAALAPLRHERFVLLTLVAGWIVCPCVARALVAVVPLDRPYAVGLLVLSLAPGAPFAPAMMQIARADAAYTAGYMVLASVATVVLMPAMVPLLIDDVAADPVLIARPLLAFVLLPLLVGFAVRHYKRELAEWAARGIAAITKVTGAVLLVLVAVRYGRDVLGAVGSYAIATQVIFMIAVTLIAHLGGAGLPAEQRSVLTLGTSARNLGAALAPLAAIEGDPRALVMIVISAPITLAVSMVTARWLARRAVHAPQSA
jgi:bile acid:Na+ symporter, BASS family